MLHGLYGNHRICWSALTGSAMLRRGYSKPLVRELSAFVDGLTASTLIPPTAASRWNLPSTNDLVPYREHVSRVKRSQDHAIGGISMGGYGAARFVLHHSDYFSKGIRSPSVWTNNLLTTTLFTPLSTPLATRNHQLVMDCTAVPPLSILVEAGSSQVSFCCNNSDDGVVPCR